MTQAPIPPEIVPDLERVDQIVAERATTRPVVAGIAAQHLAPEEGRLRAAIVLLAARLGDYALERAAHAAASVELIAAASGVHDELVDEAERRRGTVGSEPRWGGGAALMVGDYLLALSAAEMALTPDPQIIAYYSRSLMAICEGQMAPVTVVAPLEQAREQYLYRIGCVSASLFASAAAAGGVCGGLRQDQVDALEQFGHELGLALQITADARDYTGAGRALRAGIITLPLIYAVHAGGPQLAERLDAPADDATVRATLDEVQRLGGVERARADAAAHAARARAHLASLPPGAARDALAAITDAAVS